MSHPHKTPQNVADVLKKMSPADQVVVQTYIAKLKSTLKDLEEEILTLKDGDAHAHFHGHEKCTHDHSHDAADHGEKHEEHGHDHGHEKHEEHGTDHGHEREHDHHGHDHGHEHAHDHTKCKGDHSHGHHHHEDDKPSIPEWKKRAMDSDPMAAPFGGTWTTESSVDATADMPALYQEGEDYEKASNCKQEANELKANGDYEAALAKYTDAILAAPPSALLYANRADCLLKMQNYRAAMRDGQEALKLNPDSAKALRMLGEAQKSLHMWKEARANLSAAQTIDFDDAVVEDLKMVSEKVMEMEANDTKKRVEEEERKRKRAEEIKRAREEAAKASAPAPSAPRGMPPGGMPDIPGMPPGMGNIMSTLMSDPELAEGMKNPKVQAAFQGLMSQPGGAMGLLSNPAKLQELMTDPDVGPFMKKLMSKLGGGMPGMMPGGFGGGAPASSHNDDDDMEDVPDVPMM